MKSLSILLLIFLSSRAINAIEFIGETCSKTLYPDICAKVLGSRLIRPDTPGTELINIVLETMSSHGDETYSQLNQMIVGGGQTKDKGYIEALVKCSHFYDLSVNRFVPEAQRAIQDKDYHRSVISMTSAYNAGLDCEDAFSDEGHYAFPIKARNDYFEHLCDIALALTKLYGGME